MKEMGVSVGNNIPTIDYVKSMQELIDEIRKMLFGFTFKRHLLRGFFIKSGRILRSFFSLQISFQIPPLTILSLQNFPPKSQSIFSRQGGVYPLTDTSHKC